MKNLDAIINEQAMLLMWKGYNEKHLYNGDPEGSYKEQLKTALQDLLEKDTVLLDKEPFYIQLFGYFDRGQDKVLFTFSYEYDALLSQISLKQVEARLNDVPITIPIETGSDLWSSKELYERIKPLSLAVGNALSEEEQKLLEGLVRREVLLLRDNGYIHPQMEAHFKRAIAKAEQAPDKRHDFIIEGKVKVDGCPEIMQYRLHYYYHPTIRKLSLKSLNARMNAVSRTFLGTDKFPVPSAWDIYEYLMRECKTLAARKFINQEHPPVNSRSRKI